jgi:retron-type reverse transcriptase
MRKIFNHEHNDIISVENLLLAWKEFKQGKTKKDDVQEFEIRLMDNILSLHNDLKNKMYAHGGYKYFVVNDPKRRDIHKASVRDRLLHHALYRKLYPFFDTTFIADSYSCRGNKGTHRAMRRFDLFARKESNNHTKNVWVLKCDIRKFFASINHGILLGILRERIEDEDILKLLENIICSFDSGVKGEGIPLGNLTSQLLVNIYMNEFDQYVKHILKVKYYIRYADDFVFMLKDRSYLEELCQKIEDFLTQELRLSLHPDKVFIKTLASGVDFLGWVHFPKHKVLRTTTKKRMLRKVNEKNVTSYLGLLAHGNGYKIQEDIMLRKELFM